MFKGLTAKKIFAFKEEYDVWSHEIMELNSYNLTIIRTTNRIIATISELRLKMHHIFYTLISDYLGFVASRHESWNRNNKPLLHQAMYMITSGKVGEGNAFCRDSERERKKSVDRRDWLNIDAATFDYHWYEIFNRVATH